MCCFRTRNLLLSKKCVPLHCVFHSIRFKVNKGWSTAVLLFLCLCLVSLFNEIVTPFHTFVFLYSSALAGGRGVTYFDFIEKERLGIDIKKGVPLYSNLC